MLKKQLECTKYRRRKNRVHSKRSEMKQKKNTNCKKKFLKVFKGTFLRMITFFLFACKNAKSFVSLFFFVLFCLLLLFFSLSCFASSFCSLSWIKSAMRWGIEKFFSENFSVCQLIFAASFYFFLFCVFSIVVVTAVLHVLLFKFGHAHSHRVNILSKFSFYLGARM